jgi:hypothetical protein
MDMAKLVTGGGSGAKTAYDDLASSIGRDVWVARPGPACTSWRCGAPAGGRELSPRTRASTDLLRCAGRRVGGRAGGRAGGPGDLPLHPPPPPAAAMWTWPAGTCTCGT